MIEQGLYQKATFPGFEIGFRFMQRYTALILVLLCVGVQISGCTTTSTVGVPIQEVNLRLIETQLKQGVSSKMDVQRLLGTPSGFGGALFPKAVELKRLLGREETQELPAGVRYPKDENGYDVWFYQHLKVKELDPKTITSGSKYLGGAQNVILQYLIEQKLLLIFFSKDKYEGYAWYIGGGVIDVDFD